MRRREGESYSLGENEALPDKPVVAADESGLRKDLMERPFLFCLFQKQPNSFYEILLGLSLSRSTGREIKFRRVRNVHFSFFEHLTRKFNLHRFHHLFCCKAIIYPAHELTTSFLTDYRLSPAFIIGTLGRNDKLKVCAISQSSHHQ